MVWLFWSIALEDPEEGKFVQKRAEWTFNTDSNSGVSTAVALNLLTISPYALFRYILLTILMNILICLLAIFKSLFSFIISKVVL